MNSSHSFKNSMTDFNIPLDPTMLLRFKTTMMYERGLKSGHYFFFLYYILPAGLVKKKKKNPTAEQTFCVSFPTLCFDIIHSWTWSFDCDLTWTGAASCIVYSPQPEPTHKHTQTRTHKLLQWQSNKTLEAPVGAIAYPHLVVKMQDTF